MISLRNFLANWLPSCKKAPCHSYFFAADKKWVYSRKFPILHDRMCFACKLCLLSRRSPAATMRVLCAAYCCITPHPFDSCGGIPKKRKCLNFDTEIRWHLYGKFTAKGRNRNFATPSFTAKGWKLYGKNMARVRQKYGIYTERPLGAKFPGSVLAWL